MTNLPEPGQFPGADEPPPGVPDGDDHDPADPTKTNHPAGEDQAGENRNNESAP